MESVHLSSSLLKAFANNTNIELLTNNKARSVTNINGKLFVCVGYSSSGEKGIHWMSLQECIPIQSHNGKTYTYSERQDLVNVGKLERGNYQGQRFLCSGQYFVFVGDKITAYPVKEAEQLNLF